MATSVARCRRHRCNSTARSLPWVQQAHRGFAESCMLWTISSVGRVRRNHIPSRWALAPTTPGLREAEGTNGIADGIDGE